VREDGRIVGGEEWQEKVYDREKWQRLLRTSKNHRVLHMPMEWNRIEFTKGKVRHIVHFNPSYGKLHST
jgi:hypothetical protein